MRDDFRSELIEENNRLVRMGIDKSLYNIMLLRRYAIIEGCEPETIDKHIADKSKELMDQFETMDRTELMLEMILSMANNKRSIDEIKKNGGIE